LIFYVLIGHVDDVWGHHVGGVSALRMSTAAKFLSTFKSFSFVWQWWREGEGADGIGLIRHFREMFKSSPSRQPYPPSYGIN
jgi:hypothetical protein